MDQPAKTADSIHSTSPLFDDCLVCHVDNVDPTIALPNSKCLACHSVAIRLNESSAISLPGNDVMCGMS